MSEVDLGLRLTARCRERACSCTTQGFFAEGSTDPRILLETERGAWVDLPNSGSGALWEKGVRSTRKVLEDIEWLEVAFACCRMECIVRVAEPIEAKRTEERDPGKENRNSSLDHRGVLGN